MRPFASRSIAGVALLYLAAGLVFGALAGRAASLPERAGWRWAAWIVSGIAFTAHVIAGLRGEAKPREAAARAAGAAALGAFGLAVAANIHAWHASARHPPLLALSLLIWPAMTALPAFLVALVVGRAWLVVRRPR